MSEARTRLTLDLSSRLNGAIEDYADAHGLSKSDVLRNAVSFLLSAERAVEEGMKIKAVKEENNRIIEREIGAGIIQNYL